MLLLKLSFVFILLLKLLCPVRSCTYDVDEPVNPASTCTVINVKHIPRDADLFVPDLSHVTSVTYLLIQNTGITTLPDISAMKGTMTTLRLFNNKKLTVIPGEILGQFQKLRTLIISFNNILTTLPDVSLSRLTVLQMFKTFFTVTPYLPEMGKTITVSAQLNSLQAIHIFQ